MRTIKDRLSEPSTWAGFATIALALGQMYPPLAPIVHSVAPLLGGISVVLREQS